MLYGEVRKEIRDGDLIAVRGNTSKPLNRLIAWATSSPYTHTGTALWLGDRLWLSEMKADGNHLVLLSHYSMVPFDVFPCPVPRADFLRAALDNAETYRGYDFNDLLALLWRFKLRIELPEDADEDVVCSGLSWLEYCAAGAPWPKRTRVAPAELVSAIGAAPVVAFRP